MKQPNNISRLERLSTCSPPCPKSPSEMWAMGYELNRRVVSVLNLSGANIIQKYSKIAKYFPKFKSYQLFHQLSCHSFGLTRNGSGSFYSWSEVGAPERARKWRSKPGSIQCIARLGAIERIARFCTVQCITRLRTIQCVARFGSIQHVTRFCTVEPLARSRSVQRFARNCSFYGGLSWRFKLGYTRASRGKLEGRTRTGAGVQHGVENELLGKYASQIKIPKQNKQINFSITI